MGDELRRPPPEETGLQSSSGKTGEVPSAASGWSRILRLVLGWTLVGLGIIGLFVPILQGILLISLGLLTLSRESPALRRLGRRLGKRFPFLQRLHDRIQRRKGLKQRRNGRPGDEHDG